VVSGQRRLREDPGCFDVPERAFIQRESLKVVIIYAESPNTTIYASCRPRTGVRRGPVKYSGHLRPVSTSPSQMTLLASLAR
jgi:hypothetical protein